MEVKKKKDWFKIKRYPHIGLPLDNRDRFKWIEPYEVFPVKLQIFGEYQTNHSFLHKISRDEMEGSLSVFRFF